MPTANPSLTLLPYGGIVGYVTTVLASGHVEPTVYGVPRAVSEIWSFKDFGVMTLTFWGHISLSVT